MPIDNVYSVIIVCILVHLLRQLGLPFCSCCCGNSCFQHVCRCTASALHNNVCLQLYAVQLALPCMQMLLAEDWTYLLWILSSTMMCRQTPKTTSIGWAEQLGPAGGSADTVVDSCMRQYKQTALCVAAHTPWFWAQMQLAVLARLSEMHKPVCIGQAASGARLMPALFTCC